MDVEELIGSQSSEVPTRDPTDTDCMGMRVDNQTSEFKGYCRATPGRGTDHVGEGRCSHHGGNNGGAREGAGAPEDNGNAETHSLKSDPGKYYRRQSETQQARIDSWAESWVRRSTVDGSGCHKVLHTTAVTLHQIEQADAYIADEGVIVEKIIDRTESGEAITQADENPAFLLKSRAMKDVVRTLKEWGVLNDPDTQQADSVDSLAKALSGQAGD